MHGFTLIELMVTIAVAAILLTVGVPSFRSLLENQRLTTAVNDLHASINLTRAEAVQRGTRVDLAPLDGKSWAKGWAVFIEKKEVATQIPDMAADEIIYSIGSIPDGITITTKFTDETTQYIAYNATGRTRVNSSNQQPQSGAITLTLEGVETLQKRIILNFMGRPRVCDPVKESTTCKESISEN